MEKPRSSSPPSANRQRQAFEQWEWPGCQSSIVLHKQIGGSITGSLVTNGPCHFWATLVPASPSLYWKSFDIATCGTQTDLMLTFFQYTQMQLTWTASGTAPHIWVSPPQAAVEDSWFYIINYLPSTTQNRSNLDIEAYYI